MRTNSARQTARMEGAIIPPTPLHELGAAAAHARRPEPSAVFAQPVVCYPLYHFLLKPHLQTL